MKACPKCGRLYPVDAGFCPVDGGELISASQFPIPPSGDDQRLGQIAKERYQIRRVVADGGMGRVYEALDLQENRNVALKILHSDVAADAVQVERFKREFDVSKELPHEHIVDVIDFFTLADGSYVMVMEFLFGEELRQLLAREKFLSPERVVRMLSQIAVGLDEAHTRQLVHRDLKPDNIFLCQTREGDIVKILDFGSVKDRAAGAKRLTVMGTTIGSPFYMAPEQAQALDTLDHRADVWAMGAIVYECIVGKVPFTGGNGPQILLSILSKEAPQASFAEDTKYDIPPSIDPVLEKTFKKTASLRYESVGAMADAIGNAYGLTGDHKQWATTNESTLHRRIAEEMARLMASPRVYPQRTEMDDFFGESDSLGDAVPSKDPMARAMKSAERTVEEPLPMLSMPVRSTGIPLWVFVFVGAVFIAITAFFAL